jgi:hypothetical protein
MSPRKNNCQIMKAFLWLFFNTYSFIEEMSSLSDVNLITLLNNISTQITRYFGIIIFLFGVIGNFLNILVLSQRALRSNPCACLFLVSSIAYLISILTGLLPRFLSTWNADLTSTNQVLCKIRIFIFFISITVAFWLIMLATVDRWLSSSMIANRRQKSSLKNAQRGMIIIIILSTLIEIQQIFCYEANLTNTPLKCYSKTVICGIASDTCFALITILFPLLLMLIFGLMIISNVRKTQLRLQPMDTTNKSHIVHNTTTASNAHQTQQRKKDRQLLLMLFVQVLLMFVLTVPFALSKIYTSITRNTPKSPLRNTIETFIFNLFLLFLNIASGMPFYIYTLNGGSLFRKTLFDLMKTVGRKMICQHN